MTAKILYDDQGEPEYVLLPFADWQALTGVDDTTIADEDLCDEALFDKYKDEESIPFDMALALAAGDKSPIQIWRKHRGMTQDVLARKCEINRVYLSQIETGRRQPSTALLRRLATVLDSSVDDLLPAVDED